MAGQGDSEGGSDFDSLPDGVVIVDLDGTISYVNHQLVAWSGYSAADLIGQSIEMLVPDALRTQHRSHRSQYVAAGAPTRPMGGHLRTRLLTSSGEELWVDIALRQVRTGRGPQVLAAVRDATERIRAQGRIESLLEVSQHILANQATDEVLSLIARRARRLVDADVATISVPSSDRTEMVTEVADGRAEDELRGSRLPVDGSLAGEAFRTGRSQVIREPADVQHSRYLLGSVGFGPAIVVALRAPGASFGAISIARLAGREPFVPGEVQIVELFANQAAVALDYSRVRDELRRLAVLEDRERISRELHDGVIQSLFAVGMNLQASSALAGPGALQDRIDRGVEELDRAIRDLRNYIFGLRPGILADRQLGQAIEQLAAETEEKYGISVAVEVETALASKLAPAASDIIQLVRESLSNVARHSHAATCRVSLLPADGRASLVIEDDGIGYDVTIPGAAGEGLGNLRSRVARLGGELIITSSAAEGTRVEALLPA